MKRVDDAFSEAETKRIKPQNVRVNIIVL